MVEAVRAFLENLVPNLRPTDFIDIALVAAFLYVLISWMRQSTSLGTRRRIAIILLLFAAVYLPARFLDMYLVGRVTELVFIALLLAVVVVFQSDLRRMLDQAGTWLFSDTPSAADNSSPVDQLVEAAAKMAEEKTGALIAIRGNEPWGRHVHGGVDLGGAVSPPLLYSIFDHRTPGHDGALLIEGDRIVKFAAHLPLANNEPEVSQYGGTRHAAALGLAEHCDAFVIVVSEERGTISVAHNGEMEEVETPGELKERLGQFWEEYYGEEAHPRRARLSMHNLQTAALSITFAVALWLLFAYSPGTVYRSFEVPIEYRNAPPEWLLEDGEQWANVTISGPEQAFRLINPERLAIALDMEEPEEGWNEFAVDRSDLNLPEQLSLENVQPQTVRINARPMRSVTLPVSVPTEGELPSSLQLVGLEPEPDSVSVLVLEEGSGYNQISTEPVDLSEVSGEETTFERPLVLAPDMRFPPDGETAVEVHVEVEPAEEEGGSG